MILLKRAAEQEQHRVRLTLRGTSSGELLLFGDGFRAEACRGEVHKYTATSEGSTEQLGRILQAAGIGMVAGPVPDNDGFAGP